MKRLLKEPLLHFVLLGAALFVAFSVVSARMDRPDDDEIVVSAGKIEHLAALFGRTWQRPPTRGELEGLVDDFVREEVAYREGLAVGLDRDDTIIRRRLRQKLEFVAEDLVSRVTPTDDDLEAYLAAHPEQFRLDARLTFRHVFLDPEQRGDAIDADARDLLVTLNGDPSTTDVLARGDRILLEPGYAAVTQRDVANLFGPRFATALADLAPGSWQGPIASSYGAHLVIVDERRDGRRPELAEVRAAVEREWSNARRTEATEAFYTSLIDRYRVTVQWPDVAAEQDS
ncbi:MAG: peptidyl-prolyl cis-trans isomerase [Planctomycetota bacterium]|jgi:hypothetical protein